MESKYKKIADLKEGDSVYVTDGSSRIRKLTIRINQTIDALLPFDKGKAQMDHIVLSNGKEYKIWRKNEMTVHMKNGTLNISSISYETCSISRLFTTLEEAQSYVKEKYEQKRLELFKKIDELQKNLTMLNAKEKAAMEIVS